MVRSSRLVPTAGVRMSDLTQFLLARIAEGISDAREVQALAVSRGVQPDDPREPSLRVARRLLADCSPTARRSGGLLRQSQTLHGLVPTRCETWCLDISP